MCGLDFCSMMITEDVRRYATEKGLTAEEALTTGLEKKAKEFVEKDSKIYAKA